MHNPSPPFDALVSPEVAERKRSTVSSVEGDSIVYSGSHPLKKHSSQTRSSKTLPSISASKFSEILPTLFVNFYRHTFATMSFIAEIFIFVYVGMDALDIEKWKLVSDSPGKSIAVSSTLLALVLVGRAAFVFPLSFLSNLTKKTASEKIEFKQQITIWWAGLMRGAVSMALAYNQFSTPSDIKLRPNAIVITSTISVVLFSTIVFGLLTKPLVKLLLPSKHFTSMTSEDPYTPKSLTMPLLNGQASEFETQHVHRPPSLQTFLRTPTHTVHYYWRKFDDAVMRPLFGGRGFAPFVPGSPTEQSLHQLQ